MAKYRSEIEDNSRFDLEIDADTDEEARKRAMEFFTNHTRIPENDWGERFPKIKVLKHDGSGGVLHVRLYSGEHENPA